MNLDKELKELMAGDINLADYGIDGALETIDEDIPPCTATQRSYVYGMCAKLGYNPRKLPKDISPKEETRDLNIAEMTKVIDTLKDEYEIYKENQREEESEWGIF